MTQAISLQITRGRPNVRWLLRLLLALAIVSITLITANRERQHVLRQIATHVAGETNDFDRFITMTPEFLNGRANFVDDRFPTPPITIAILAPLSRLSRANAEFVWGCIKPLFFCGTFWFCRAMLHRGGARLTPAATALMITAWFWPVIGDMQEGQMNLLMLLPLAAALWFAQRQTPRLDWAAGLLLGLAICIKVTPLIFIPYFLLRRRWRLASAALMGMALFLILIPSLIFGAERNLTLLIGWSDVMILPYVLHGHVVYPYGVSLPSFLTRTLRHIPAFVSNEPGYPSARFFNLADLAPETVGRVIHGVLLAIVAAGTWWMRRPLRSFAVPRYLLEVGAVAAFMLLASERTWIAHYVTLILPLFAAGMVASHTAFTRQTRQRALWAVGTAALFMYLTSDFAKMLAGPDGRQYVETVNLPLWASLMLVASIVSARRTPAGGENRLENIQGEPGGCPDFPTSQWSAGG